MSNLSHNPPIDILLVLRAELDAAQAIISADIRKMEMPLSDWNAALARRAQAYNDYQVLGDLMQMLKNDGGTVETGFMKS